MQSFPAANGSKYGRSPAQLNVCTSVSKNTKNATMAKRARATGRGEGSIQSMSALLCLCTVLLLFSATHFYSGSLGPHTDVNTDRSADTISTARYVEVAILGSRDMCACGYCIRLDVRHMQLAPALQTQRVPVRGRTENAELIDSLRHPDPREHIRLRIARTRSPKVCVTAQVVLTLCLESAVHAWRWTAVVVCVRDSRVVSFYSMHAVKQSVTVHPRHACTRRTSAGVVLCRQLVLIWCHATVLAVHCARNVVAIGCTPFVNVALPFTLHKR